jgi:hypothetical protein
MRNLALLLLVVAACKKSETTAPATGSAAATATSASAGSSGSGSSATATAGSGASEGSASSAAAAASGKIDCAKVIPQSVADTYFKGLPQEHGEPSGTQSGDTVCRFMIDKKDNKKILVEYQCGGDMTDLEAYLAGQQKLFPKRTIKRVPGIGRGAFQLGPRSYGAQHRTLPCVIWVDLDFVADKDPFLTQDYFPALRELEAALPDAP